MSYRYRLTSDPRNSDIQYRIVNGVTIRKDRWLVTETPIDVHGLGDLVECENDSIKIAPVQEMRQPV